MNEKIIVTVPATSANLGPGFDCLGIALSLYNRFHFTKNEKYDFTNVRPAYQNLNNLVIVSACKTYEYLKVKETPFILSIEEEVPTARGLGSSACCIVAGVMAANYFTGNTLTKKEILEIATSLEGHPDNVAPAIFGGLVSSFTINNQNQGLIIPTIYDVHKALAFVVMIPEFELETKKARSVLPKSLSYHDAIYNMSRAINIPKAMEHGEVGLLYYLLDDLWHEPYRRPLIVDSQVFKDYSIKNQVPFCLSGSGSTLLYITKLSKSDNIRFVDEIKRLPLKCEWEVKILECDVLGATMEVV